MYVGNKLGVSIPVPASYYRGVHVPVELRTRDPSKPYVRERGTGPTVFQAPVIEYETIWTGEKKRKAIPVSKVIAPVKPKIKVTTTAKPIEWEKKTRRPFYIRRDIRTGRLMRPQLGQWEAAIPVAVSVGAKIFGGKGSGEKKAASQARRSARAQKAMALLVPFSDLIDNARWAQIASGFERFMQVGINGGVMTALIVNGTPYAFAKQAADAILATSPASIIEKRGGQPAWVALQTGIRAAILQRKPEPIRPPTVIPSPAFLPAGRPPPIYQGPTPVYQDPYAPAWPFPGAPSFPTYAPTPRPEAQAPRIITVPSPAPIVEQAAPAQAGINPTWLMMGGLGLAAVMMINR